MPLAGGWSGCRSKNVQLEPVPYVCFLEDKETSDPVHARLAKKIAARESQKAAGHGQRQETGQGGTGGTGAQGH